MGLRIHKRIGWGLSDLQLNENLEIIDPRIDREGYLFRQCDENNEEIFTIEDYIKILKKAKRGTKDNSLSLILKLNIADMKNCKCCISDCVFQDLESEIPSVLHFIPPCYSKEWIKCDNVIDHYEELEKNGQTDRYQLLTSSPFPYIHWIDIASLDKNSLPQKKYFCESINFLNYYFGNDFDNKEVENEIQKKFGFSTIEEYKRRIIPAIPEELILFAKYLKIFKEDKYIFDLRPMIITYWI